MYERDEYLRYNHPTADPITMRPTSAAMTMPTIPPIDKLVDLAEEVAASAEADGCAVEIVDAVAEVTVRAAWDEVVDELIDVVRVD